MNCDEHAGNHLNIMFALKKTKNPNENRTFDEWYQDLQKKESFIQYNKILDESKKNQ